MEGKGIKKGFSKNLKDILYKVVLPLPSYLLIKLLYKSVRAHFHGKEKVEKILKEGKNYILCFWHGTLLLMVYAFLGKKRTFLVSYHRDGELITRVIKRFGIEATRGSTTRGAIKAFLSLLKKARQNYSIAFTPDGPRGPARSVHNGIIELARRAEIPIVPVGFFAKNKIILNSWDSFIIPMPFTKIVYYYGDPLYVTDEEKNYTTILEEEMKKAEEMAKSICIGS